MGILLDKWFTKKAETVIIKTPSVTVVGAEGKELLKTPEVKQCTEHKWEWKDSFAPKRSKSKTLFDLEVEKLLEQNPPPDLDNKPDDIGEYAFAFCCSDHHCNEQQKEVIPEDFKRFKVCQQCGDITRIAIVRRIAEAYWGPDYSQMPYPGQERTWRWHQYVFGKVNWNKVEFVKFVESMDIVKEIS